MALSIASHGAGIAALSRLPPGERPAPASAQAEGPSLRVALREDKSVPTGRPASERDAGRTTSNAKKRRTSSPASRFYYPAHLLDERPLVRVHVEPAFPRFAPVSEARVVLQLFISEDGRIDEVKVRDTSAPEAFRSSAASAFARALFTPGRIAGKPVRSTLTIEVLFGAPVPLESPQAKADAPR